MNKILLHISINDRPVFATESEAFSGSTLCAAGGICPMGTYGQTIGFLQVVASPLTRSSYHADEVQRLMQAYPRSQDIRI